MSVTQLALRNANYHQDDDDDHDHEVTACKEFTVWWRKQSILREQGKNNAQSVTRTGERRSQPRVGQAGRPVGPQPAVNTQVSSVHADARLQRDHRPAPLSVSGGTE